MKSGMWKFKKIKLFEQQYIWEKIWLKPKTMDKKKTLTNI